MAERWVSAAFVRGGTSKGLFFEARALPETIEERNAFLLAALGPPTNMGASSTAWGADCPHCRRPSSSSPLPGPGSTLTTHLLKSRFDKPIVDYAANCGNLASAVGPYAVDQGLVIRPDGPATVRLFNTNTNKAIDAHFEVEGGCARVDGDLRIPGVEWHRRTCEARLPRTRWRPNGQPSSQRFGRRSTRNQRRIRRSISR